MKIIILFCVYLAVVDVTMIRPPRVKPRPSPPICESAVPDQPEVNPGGPDIQATPKGSSTVTSAGGSGQGTAQSNPGGSAVGGGSGNGLANAGPGYADATASSVGYAAVTGDGKATGKGEGYAYADST